jgi:hypothetical protein
MIVPAVLSSIVSSFRLQAVSKNFATLAALRVISGAFEAIADPAFMLFTTMYYTRAVSASLR